MKKNRKKKVNKTKKKNIKKLGKNKKKFSVKKKVKKLKKKKTSLKKRNNFSLKGKKKILIDIINFQEKIKPNIKIKFNPFVSIDRFLQRFFENVSNTIIEYKSLKKEQKRISKIKELEKIEKEKLEKEKRIKEEKDLQSKLKEQILKDEVKLEKERAKDIKLFLRKEQAIIRQEQAEKQRKFLEQIKLERKIEQFRKREALEIKNLEKYVLSQQRESYEEVQLRIDKIKEKYKALREQKVNEAIRERVAQLGIKIEDTDNKETLLEKERIYNKEREKIEYALESFYRSAHSLCFQINKRYIPKYLSIMRVVDRRFETGEIFIKWDDTAEDDWLILIYIKNNSPDEGIVIEDKSDSEKHKSYEFKSNEIFRASDLMVDSLTKLLDRERNKKKVS